MKYLKYRCFITCDNPLKALIDNKQQLLFTIETSDESNDRFNYVPSFVSSSSSQMLLNASFTNKRLAQTFDEKARPSLLYYPCKQMPGFFPVCQWSLTKTGDKLCAKQACKPWSYDPASEWRGRSEEPLVLLKRWYDDNFDWWVPLNCSGYLGALEK